MDGSEVIGGRSLWCTGWPGKGPEPFPVGPLYCRLLCLTHSPESSHTGVGWWGKASQPTLFHNVPSPICTNQIYCLFLFFCFVLGFGHKSIHWCLSMLFSFWTRKVFCLHVLKMSRMKTETCVGGCLTAFVCCTNAMQMAERNAKNESWSWAVTVFSSYYYVVNVVSCKSFPPYHSILQPGGYEMPC